MKTPLKTLEPNLHGRDYVIGDLHGSYSAFTNLLRNIKFDESVDRIISVGDLVDRGPNSLQCLQLLRKPWFHAVFANHEQMMVDKFNGGWSGAYWYRNGGQWGMEAYNDYKAVYAEQDQNRIPTDASYELFSLLPLTEELPFLITVATKSGKKFHILHAELPPTRLQITDDMLGDPKQVYLLATTQSGDGDAFLWSRAIYGEFYAKNLDDRNDIIADINSNRFIDMYNDDLSHIISGHTIMQRPTTILGQTNIDTGAYSSYYVPAEPYGPASRPPPAWAALTCVELDTWTFYKVTDVTFETVLPYVITEEDLDV